MRYRLDAPHYINDRYIDAGVEIGDETGFPFRYERDTAVTLPDGTRWTARAGEALPPSSAMIPLDDEAKRAYAEKFYDVKPDRDPTAKIPVMGNVKEQSAQSGHYPMKEIKAPEPVKAGAVTLKKD